MLNRLQILAGIQLNELNINNPHVQIPEGWSEIKLDEEDITEGIVHWFFAPMEGWDKEHSDDVQIIERKNNKFVIRTSYAFAESKYEPNKFDSISSALKRAYEIMTEISDDWDDEDDMDGYFGDEEDEDD